MLPAADYLTDLTHTSYDVWPDGSGFLTVKPMGGEARPVLVHNRGREAGRGEALTSAFSTATGDGPLETLRQAAS
jgi:hypothetical protein